MRENTQDLFACSLMHFVNDGLFYAIYFIIPLAALEFNLSFAEASLIKTFFSLSSSLFQYPVTLLARTLTDMGLLALGTGWVGLGMVVMGLSTGIWGLWIYTVSAGIGGNAQHPVASSLISRVFPSRRRGSAMGTLNFAGDAGKAAFGGLMSFLLLSLSWRQALYFLGGGAALFSVLWYTILHRMGRKSGIGDSRPVGNDSSGAREETKKIEPPSDVTRGRSGERIQRRRFILLSVIGMFDNATRSTLLTFLPFLYLAKGLGKEQLGVYLMLIAVGGLFGKLGCGILADYFGNVAMIVATEFLTVSLIILCLFFDPGTGLVLAAFLGFFLNGTSSVIYSQVAGIIPASTRTRGYGLFFTLTLSAAAIVPLLFGILGDLSKARYGEWTGIVAIFSGMAAMASVTIPLAAVFHLLGRSQGWDAGK